MADDEHLLVAVVHHIAADGWSLRPLVADLGMAYASRSVGAGAGLGADCPCSTSTTPCGSARSSASSTTVAARSPRSSSYWEDALAGMPERLELPTDRPYPLVADQRGATVEVDWPAELQQQVATVAREHNATSFMVIQAALAVLLSNLSASSDVAVGFPIAGRRDPALDDLVGFFVNTLVLRVDLDGNPSVAELLAQVRARSLAAYEHQDVPFEVLVERLNPTRSLTHHPLVQVMLGWQNLPWQNGPDATGWSSATSRSPRCRWTPTSARMDLAFSLSESWSETGDPAGIGGVVEFRTDVFDAASVETLVRAVPAGVDGDDGRPDARRCRRWICSTDDERARLDGVGNRAVLDAAGGRTVSIPEAFAVQVAARPDAVAVSGAGRSVTYAEVDEASNRLAHMLIDHGVGPGPGRGADVRRGPPRRSPRCWRC